MKAILFKSISVGDAVLLGQKAMDVARGKGYNICVSIVDYSGVVKLSMRDDNANFITPESSRKKAFTACAMGLPTIQVVMMSEKNPLMVQLSEASDSVMIYGGGRPILFNGDKIGGIGIAGAPGGHFDDDIAQEALNLCGFESV